MDRSQLDSLAEAVLAGQQRPVARALSMVEDGHPESHELLHRLYDPGRASTTVGVTGPPGAGKSTLANRLIDSWRRDG
ncbi:MAG: methylmalonyl Co-A mutase-associated GTPase MeaB, partial [Candidatus Fermentibacterota bacterium]